MGRVFDLVLFGATGDLSLRKLLPSIYRAFKEKKFSAGTQLFLSCRSQENFDALLDIVRQSLCDYLSEGEFDDKVWQSFVALIKPTHIDLSCKNTGWQQLARQLQKNPDRIRVFYLAVPSTVYGQCCSLLAHYKMINRETRLVVEKPIGYDLVSSEQINAEMAAYFEEEQIYRIDHYLGKETVLNLQVLRFSNSLFERFWDAGAIDHIQISINERVGLEGRAGFYDDTGALRDMVQNHLLQLLCLVAMESPSQLSADNLRNEKIKILQSLRPIKGKDVDTYTVRGQYISGIYDDKIESGYLEDLGVAESNTETFVAIKAYIDNWQWSKVPFYLRTGKRLNRQSAEIIIQFKDVTHNLYPEQKDAMLPNRMIIQLQPEERLQLIMMAKDMTKLETTLKPVVLDLNFTDQIKGYRSYAYKRLLLDAVDGNNRLFIHRDEVVAAWRWIDPIIERWKQSKESLTFYRSGTSGPKASEALIEKDKRHWVDIYRPTKN